MSVSGSVGAASAWCNMYLVDGVLKLSEAVCHVDFPDAQCARFENFFVYEEVLLMKTVKGGAWESIWSMCPGTCAGPPPQNVEMVIVWEKWLASVFGSLHISLVNSIHMIERDWQLRRSSTSHAAQLCLDRIYFEAAEAACTGATFTPLDRDTMG